MIKKIEERRIAKTTNLKGNRRVNNQLRRAKEVYFEETCEEILDLQKKGKYDLMYQNAQQLGEKTSKAVRTFGIEQNHVNLAIDHRKALRLKGKYIQDLYDSENRPKDIAIEAEEELDDNDKGPTIL